MKDAPTTDAEIVQKAYEGWLTKLCDVFFDAVITGTDPEQAFSRFSHGYDAARSCRGSLMRKFQ